MTLSNLHHFGDIPDTNLSPLGGSSQELWAAAKTIAGNLVGAVGAVGKLGRTGGQRHGQRHVLCVLTLHEGTVWRVSLMFRPGE